MARKRARFSDSRVVNEASGDALPPAAESVEVEPEIDMVAFCVSCGTNDPSVFSKRMLHKRGRHGDRVRRCRACVNAAEQAELQKAAEPAISTSSPCADCGVPLDSGSEHLLCVACGMSAVEQSNERQRKKLLKMLRQIEELKMKRASGIPLEQTQLQKIEREATLQEELLRMMPNASLKDKAEPQPADRRTAAPPLAAAEGICDAQGGRDYVQQGTPNQAASNFSPNASISDEVRRKPRTKGKKGWAHALIADPGASAEARGLQAATLSLQALK